MLNLKQRRIDKCIDMHCVVFLFPSSVEDLFSFKEMIENSKTALSIIKFLKEINKVKNSKIEEITAEQFVEYYNILITEALEKNNS